MGWIPYMENGIRVCVTTLDALDRERHPLAHPAHGIPREVGVQQVWVRRRPAD